MSAARKLEPRRLGYRWNLRQVMADRGMYSTTDLAGPLKERGIQLSAAQIYRLVAQTPERLNLKALVALCDILDCTPNDLVEPVAEEAPKTERRASAHAPSAELPKNLKPRRARIVEDEPEA